LKTPTDSVPAAEFCGLIVLPPTLSGTRGQAGCRSCRSARSTTQGSRRRSPRESGRKALRRVPCGLPATPSLSAPRGLFLLPRCGVARWPRRGGMSCWNGVRPVSGHLAPVGLGMAQAPDPDGSPHQGHLDRRLNGTFRTAQGVATGLHDEGDRKPAGAAGVRRRSRGRDRTS
jgi:hypothetical protein